MKRFLPFILSGLLTTLLACVVAWRQQVRIAGLREKIASRPVPAVPVAASGVEEKPETPAAAPVATDFVSVLSRSTSRSVMRSAQELIRHYKTCRLEEIRAMAEELGAPGRINSLETAGAFVIALSALSERDHAAAVELLGTMQGESAVPAAMIVLNDWLLRDRQAALAWFHGMKDPKQKGMILTAAAVFYGAGNPQLIEELRSGISESDVIEQASSVAVEALASTDPEAALARLDEITDDDRRARARREALTVLSAKEPQKALQMMLEPAPDGEQMNDRQVAQVLLQFMARDRQAAAQWMAGQDAALITRLLAAEPQLAAASKDK